MERHADFLKLPNPVDSTGRILATVSVFRNTMYEAGVINNATMTSNPFFCYPITQTLMGFDTY